MPTLTIIQGPDHGKTFDVDGLTSTIGRDPTCDVSLRDPGVSRFHARFEWMDDRCILKDLGAANGTFVNGIRVNDADIQTGDQIRVGNTILTVNQPPGPGALVDHRGLPIQIDSEGRVDASIITTARASGEPHAAFVGGEDMADMRTSIVGLRALYRIAEMLAHDYDIDRLLTGIMDMIFDVVDADRGVILLKEKGTGPLVPKAIRYREDLLEQIRREQAAEQVGGGDTRLGSTAERVGPPDGKATPICVSRTIINYVMQRAEGVLTTNAMQDQRF